MNIQNTHPSVLLSRRGVASATSSLRAYLSSPLLSLFIYRQLFVSLLKAICFNLRLNEGQIIIIHINNNYRTIILILLSSHNEVEDNDDVIMEINCI